MPVRNDKVTEFRVHGWNPFYDGWLAYAMGMPRKCPHEKNTDIAKEGWLLGWDTGHKTSSLNTIRYAMVKEQEARRDHVRIESVERTPLPPRGENVTG